MQEEYSLLKEQNYQLKNQISELKNAFDLNRDILKIISDESKTSQPRTQMLYQIINRLTSINNQVMINTAQLIQQKNLQKSEKQSFKRQNEFLKERIQEFLRKEQLISKNSKVNELSLYFKNKVSQLEEEMKSLQEDRIIKEHQIQFLKKKLQYYQEQQNKLSIIPTIDKISQKEVPLPAPQTLSPPLLNIRKHITNKQHKLQIKLQLLTKQMRHLKIYCQQLQYRMIALIKVLEVEEDIKEKEMGKKQKRKCLEEIYEREIVEVRLLKFALNNLVKEENQDNKELMFTLTNRNVGNARKSSIDTTPKTRQQYLYKSVQKQNKIKMKPKFKQSQEEEKQSS